MGSIHLKCEETKIITSIIAGEIMPRIRADVLYGRSNEKKLRHLFWTERDVAMSHS